MQRRALRILFIVYLLEAGAFLCMAPWSRFWDQRIVNRSPAFWATLLHSPFARGFITGLGLIHIFVAIRDLELWRREYSQVEEPPAEPGA
jgi:hypothetical protein